VKSPVGEQSSTGIRPGASPVFVMCHGFTGTRAQGDIYPRLARALALRGFASVLFGFRYGTKDQYVKTTLQTQRADVLAIVNYLRAHGHELGIDKDDIGVIGSSQGGLVAAMAAAAAPQKIQRLILLNPVVNAPVTYSNLLGGLPALLGALTSDSGALALDGWPVSSSFFRDIFRFSTEAELALYPGPALIVVSLGDELIPQPSSVESLARYHSGHTTVIQLPDSDHMFGVFSRPAESKFRDVDAVIAWILKYLSA